MEGSFSFFVLFVLGLAFGSFLNVVALRYSPEKQVFSLKRISGRSCCPKCKRTLRWYELLPLVSFVFLRGRCRTCRGKISWQYPIVELLSGLIFISVPFYFARFFGIGDLFFFRPELWEFYAFVLVWIVVFWFLLLMSIIDIRHYIIPNAVNLVLLVLGGVSVFLKMFSGGWLLSFQQSFVGSYSVLFSLFPELVEGIHYGIGSPSILQLADSGNIVLGHIIGFLIGGFFFWAVYSLTRRKGIGFGDVKLGFALGFFLGWPDILFAMLFAFIVGGAWGVGVLIARKIGSPSINSGTTLKSRLPFGPFFAIGTAMVVFAGHSILQWYFGLFNA
ncbi:MAG: prepilin peptidase [bacterium]|nr:prepilin peptidase [bacterium]